MSLDTTQAVVAVTGSILTFPLGTVIEYDDIYSKPAVTIDHGYASADGVKITGNQTTSNIMAWQNATVVRTVVTEASVTIQLTLLQTNADNKKLYFGRGVNATTGAVHWDAAETGGRFGMFIDIVDTASNKKVRYYAPSAEVTERGEMSLVSSDAVSYNMTITAYRVDVEGEPANLLIWDGPATAPVAP